MTKAKARVAARKAIHDYYCGVERECPANGCEGDLDELEFSLIFDAIMGVYFPSRERREAARVNMSDPTVQAHNLAVSRGSHMRAPGF